MGVPRRSLSLALSMAALAAACSVGGPADPGEAAGVLERLDIPEPEGITWRRQAGPVELVGTTTRAVPGELELVAGALAEIHTAVFAKAPLRFLVRAPHLGTARLHPATAAFARGPDVYLLDRTFQEPTAGTTRLGLARVVLHELAHVAQFDTLDPAYVTAVLDGRLDITDTGSGSLLVAEYAEAVGWRNASSDPLRPQWSLPDPSGTTPYGATSPEEDMAEALALVVSGRPEAISAHRARWVEQWLGVRLTTLVSGKPWAPAGSRQAFFREPLYDEALVAGRRARHVEPLYFELPPSSPPAEALAQQTGDTLRRRALNGTLTPVDDPRLARYSGEFTRADGVRFWVELWDFRGATGFRSAPEGPVLSYVMLW